MKALGLGFVFLWVCGCATAADTSVESLLSHMRDAYSAVKSARYSVATTLYAEDGTAQDFTQSFAYKRPNMILIVIKGKALQNNVITKVSDGKTINISSSAGAVAPIEFTTEAFDSGVPGNLESISFYDYGQQLSTAAGKNMEKSTLHVVNDESWDGKHWLVLEENAPTDHQICRYFVDPKTYFIWRTVITSADTKKQIVDSKITSLDANANLSDSLFVGT